MSHDLEILFIKLENTVHRIEGDINLKKFIGQEILKHSKFKKGEILHVYTDPYNNNNPTWYDCIIKKVYLENDSFSYLVLIPSIVTKYASHRFPEDELKRDYPWGKNKYKER